MMKPIKQLLASFASVLLLSACASWKTQLQDIHTEMFFAVKSNDVAACTCLLSKMSVNEIITRTEDRPLHVAATCGSVDVARLLLARGAKVNLRNRDGGTPLIAAAGAGYPAIALLLIEHGANLNLQDVHQRPAVTFAAVAFENAKERSRGVPAAAQQFHSEQAARIREVFRILVEHGARLDIKDKYGISARELIQDHPELKSILDVSPRSNRRVIH